MKSDLKIIGLTGGIASGKSLVAQQFREINIPVLDADHLGHMVLDVGMSAYNECINSFGSEILDENRGICRKKLGKIIFNDEEKRKKLEEITHPAIADMAARGLELIKQRGEPFAVYEAALLVETGIYKNMDFLILVSAKLENQLKRLAKRDMISAKEAATKIACQLPLEEKSKVADYIIKNDSTLDHLKNEAAKAAKILMERFGKIA